MKKFKKQVVIAIAAASALAITLILYTCVQSTNRTDLGATGHIISNETDSEVAPLTDVCNILVIGTDMTDGGEEYGRSDSIMIASIDPDGQAIKLISILRDSFVDIPDHGTYRINQACSLGGPELLIKTINRTFGLDLEHYIQVDFEAFSTIIDSIGGVEVEVSEEESNAVFDESKDSGTYLLDGEQALDFCRIRKIDNDFERTARQRKVLLSLYDHFQDVAETRLLTMLPKVYPYVHTNMGINDIITLYQQYKLLDGISLEQTHIPTDGTYADKVIYGQEILWLDLPANARALHQFLYGKSAAIPTNLYSPDVPESDIKDPPWMTAGGSTDELANSGEDEDIYAEFDIVEEDSKAEAESDVTEEGSVADTESDVTEESSKADTSSDVTEDDES